jgi:LuxR family transcriptional regulator, maltose regulon positive regulatory protein
MASPLVATKTLVPPVRRSLVARPRLSERLRGAAESRLTLISAPAGFGKTTLLSAWLATPGAEQRSVAWLSLDESDSRAAVFWTYTITALQTAVPGAGAGALALLQSASAPIETVLASLLNDLNAVPYEIHLVLDDYHLVDGPDLEAGMVYLLEHLPPHVHLLISSRADPALPLARMRARGELVELRAAELRFTLDEVTDYLNEVVGLDLTANDIAALEGRTEGWIAALQLAALSMRGRADVAGFIAGFAGDDRYIVDYLVEEVLRRQPEHVRSFLVQTSILDRLSGPLCDAVTAQRGGKAMLESLDRANLFVVPLDDSRRWYRYHHLFADVLQAYLLDERADETADLHRRASRWYDQNGEPSAAVRHALSAGDVERAAGLAELAIPALLRNRQESTIRGWVDALPDAVVRLRPVLAVGLIGALTSSNEFDAVEPRLRDVEQFLQQSSADMVVVDDEGLRRLPGAIQMYRAALALVRGDRPATISHARLAVDRAAADDHLTHAGAWALTGLAYWGNGDLEAAHQAYSATVVALRRVGHLSDVLGCSITLADIRMTQGRLGEARRTFEHALQLTSEHAGAALRGTADMYVGMSLIAFERNDIGTATRLLQRSQELGEQAGLPQNRYRWRVSMAHVRAAQGDLNTALQLAAEAERVYVGDFLPNVRPVPAVRARLLAVHGRVGEALSWAREQGLSVDDDLSYLREFEHVTLARVLLAHYTAHRTAASGNEAALLLEHLLSAAEAGERTGSVIEILALQALTRQARGDTPGSLAPLERALRLAEPEGYVRVFVNEGPPMVTLLRTVAKQHTSWDYVRRLVHAGGSGDRPGRVAQNLAQGLVEPLSERELVVLRLLGSDLAGPAIARELLVSLNTVRTHTRNIYAKLGVNGRREAVRQAVALNLLPPGRSGPPAE